MALKDVKLYYYNMLGQYLEEKQNLADFEQACADGYITEEQVLEAKETVHMLEENYHRLAYVMYLLEMPNRSKKKQKYIELNNSILTEFKELGADMESVISENDSALTHFRARLKQLEKTRK